MKKLNWGMIGGGKGSQIGSAPGLMVTSPLQPARLITAPKKGAFMDKA